MLANFIRDFIYYQKIDNFEEVNEYILKNIEELGEPEYSWTYATAKTTCHDKDNRNDFLFDKLCTENILWNPMDKMLEETVEHGFKLPTSSDISAAWYNTYKGSHFQEIHNHPRQQTPDGSISSYCAIYIAKLTGKNSTIFTKRQDIIWSEVQQNRENVSTADLDIGVGTVVMFPHYLDHFVNPTDTGDERITVSYNIASKYV